MRECPDSWLIYLLVKDRYLMMMQIYSIYELFNSKFMCMMHWALYLLKSWWRYDEDLVKIWWRFGEDVPRLKYKNWVPCPLSASFWLEIAYFRTSGQLWSMLQSRLILNPTSSANLHQIFTISSSNLQQIFNGTHNKCDAYMTHKVGCIIK